MTKEDIEKLIKELEWFRAYGSYISLYHNIADAEACDYADNEQS